MNRHNIGLSILLASGTAVAQGPSAVPSAPSSGAVPMEFEPVYVGAPVSSAPSAPASMIPSATASMPPSAPVLIPVLPIAPASVAAPIAPSAPAIHSSAPTIPIVPSAAAPRSAPVAPVHATTLDDSSFEERDHIYGENTSMQPRGSTMIGTVVQNEVGQQTRVGVRGREGFELGFENLRVPVGADTLSLGIITPSVYHLSLQGNVSMLTDQSRNDGTVLLRYEPVANALVRGGLVYVDTEKNALVGGQYVGSRLGGFVFNVDAIANMETQDNALARGVVGFTGKNWYVSAGGNTSGIGSSTQGFLPNFNGKSRSDARWGLLNRMWYSSDNGDQGLHLIAGPALSLEPTDVVDLDSRALGVGALGVLQGWERFTPNYAGGSVLFEILAERNEDVDTSTYGGMVYKQIPNSNNYGRENTFFGAGLAKNKVGDCKEWMVSLDESTAFLGMFTQRASIKFNPESYRMEGIIFLGTANLWENK